MNKKSVVSVGVLLAMLMANGCANRSANTITEVIKPITLSAGQEKTVLASDLFYSANYDLSFEGNNNIDVTYDVNKKEIKFIPDSLYEGMSLIEFKVDSEINYIPLIVKKEKEYRFEFEPKEKYSSVNLFGSFNGWNRTDLPMLDKDKDGIYEVDVPLQPGVYQYKFFCDGKEIVDNKNPVKGPNGFGDYNSVRTIEDNTKNNPYLHISKLSATGDKAIYSFVVGNTTKEISKNNVIALLGNKKIASDDYEILGNKIEIELDRQSLIGEMHLRVAVVFDGKVSNLQSVILVDGNPASDNYFTWNDGIIYSLMIDRFKDGDLSINSKVISDSITTKANYHGGDFQGVIDKLNEGYFDRLGINTIWLSPVYDNPNDAYREYPAPHRYYSGYHGYWPIDAVRTEEKFGSMKKLKELVEIAHDHNIKILLDFVSNHVHKEHPFFRNHPDWFGKLELPDGRLNLRFWDEFRLTTWFEPYLPSFDYIGSSEALEAMTDNAVWWLKETGADGFRHDAVKHVPNLFWRRLTEKLKKEIEIPLNKKVYQIGETFGSYELISSYVNNGQLSSQFNFNLYDVAIPTFAKESSSFESLDKEMKKTFSVYGVPHLMGNVMDSHDKNRFMAYADGDLDVSQWSAGEIGWNNPPMVDNPDSYKKLILYMAYMNTIPGLPVIYYGSEFGMTGASDPDNRRMMRFGKELSDGEKGTLNEVSNIINIRKKHSALRYGDFYTLKADKNIYAYVRSDFNERILIVLNKGNMKKEINLELPEFYNVNKVTNLVTGDILKFHLSKISIKLPPQSYGIYAFE